MRQFIRFASTTAKTSAGASKYVNKITSFGNCALYWSKVGLELGKYVWLKEGLSPPTVAQFKQVFTQDAVKFLQQAKSASPQTVVNQLGQGNKDIYIKGGAALVQLLGLFSLGEIIGRRHIYGYAKPQPTH